LISAALHGPPSRVTPSVSVILYKKIFGPCTPTMVPVMSAARSLARNAATGAMYCGPICSGVSPLNIVRSCVIRVSATGAMAFTVTPMRWNSIEAVRVSE
jgi:hypothetical protein